MPKKTTAPKKRRTTVAELSAAIVDLHAAVSHGFVSQEARIDGRIDSLEARFDGKLEAMESRIRHDVAKGFDRVDVRLEGIEQRISALEGQRR